MKKLMISVLMFLLLFTFMPAVSAQPAGDYDTYTIRSGDTLWKIAVRYQVGVSELIAANPHFKNPNLIYPGEKVYVPLYDRVNAFEKQVIELTNQERVKNGLKPLEYNWELCRVARYKSQDMLDKKYFSHTSPTYGSPFDMIRSFGISYRSAGENIAKGQKTAQAVVTGWMNSPGHRANILNAGYTQIGVGYAGDGSPHWTQMFISK
ncbi:SafA/ExsA family spore coat assembly protein [Alkalibaculum sp. M08DMB]|uniref:SafA/ExsA family spore coat assembly protein n=1 Tax=Alkalibaculum sporogenes TaxID=2655001 RepID=A0A6A7KCQ2_9FIRM|nr:SafA/ExsA family spore coat assembly protein [Alkalibaculum sporogenes]MPW27132.1 SafA/ExsA family spore coat assembly protein [Alkalibaculum sporogenes]